MILKSHENINHTISIFLIVAKNNSFQILSAHDNRGHGVVKDCGYGK